MVILIGGESHTGKTLMAQTLLERYHYPYTSLDHIKMGIVRGYKDCGFTPYDNDKVIADKLWGVVKGIIDTCIENEQNIILEGCYMPPAKVKDILCDNILTIYIIFSRHYIENNYGKIAGYENIIERRKNACEFDIQNLITENTLLKEECIKAGLKYFEVQSDYEKEIKDIYEYIEVKLST